MKPSPWKHKAYKNIKVIAIKAESNRAILKYILEVHWILKAIIMKGD